MSRRFLHSLRSVEMTTTKTRIMADHFKRFMTFSRGERIAIITIVSIIVIMLIAKYLVINNPPKRDYFKHDLDSIVARRERVMDSIRVSDSIDKVKASPSFRTKRRGIEKSSTKHVSKPRNNNQDSVGRGFLHSAPLHSASVEMTTMIDLNAADTTLLKQLPGIGGAYAKWIVNYREKLGGYCETEQLLEVYRMDTVRYDGIKDHVKIDSLFQPNKLNINADAFKILLKHPYLEYEEVKKIVNYREQKGMITSWEQLVKIIGDSANPKLRYYIDYQ